MILDVASPGADVINTTAVILAVLALLGSIATIIAPIISKRVRGASDVRDDTTAQNQTLKDAAEVAMKLVETTQINAAASIDMIKDALNVAKEQLISANNTITTLQSIISDLRSDALSDRASKSALEEELNRATHERDGFAAKIRVLEQQLAVQQSIHGQQAIAS